MNLVNGLLQRISEEQSADFSHLPKSLDSGQGFRTRSRFFFHDMITIAQPASPLLFGLDTWMGVLRIRPGSKRPPRIFWSGYWIPMLRGFRGMSSNGWWRAVPVSSLTYASFFDGKHVRRASAFECTRADGRRHNCCTRRA